MSCLVRSAAAVGVVAAALGASVREAHSHPLHTTLTEVTVDGSTLRIVLRAFVDDFAAAAVGGRGGEARGTTLPPLSDSAAARYAGANLVVTDVSGRRVVLAATGVRRAGDLVWITLAAPLARGTALRLTNSVLFERYDDQVNIVQAAIDGRRRTLLFTRRDGVAKAL